tara:strand:- start:510 stop:4040 length:3531 start_codon:yes stop_codon:yes gene_type:complete
MPTFRPKKIFSLSGSNMDFVQNVFFGDVQVDTFNYLDTTGISGVVPAAAYSSEIFVETDSSTLSLGNVNVVLDSASQVSVGELETYSGKAGDLIQLTGENFYQITDVRFGHADHLTGQFFITSPNELNVIVPSGAEWEGISVSSSLRTGLNGSTSESSGISPNEFVIIPEITGLSTGQQTTGQNVDVLGRNFNAVTGVNFNNITGSVSLVTSEIVRAEVPSGDVWGGVNLLLRSGLSHSGDANLTFKSLADITGIGPNPASGPWSPQTIPGESATAFVETGDVAAISGFNFIPEILYDAKNFDRSASGYLVGFGTEGSTGLFNIVGTTNSVLTGKIPTTCPTGTSNVFLYSNHYPEAFPSNTDFLLKYSTPVITSISPSSGLAGEVITVRGDNFYDILGADITGGAVGAGTEYTSAFIVENKQGDSVTLTVGSGIQAITTQQGYDVVISGRYGEDTSHHTDGDGFVGFGVPTVTAIDPTTNISPNQTGTITGTNLYSGDLRLSLVKDSITNVVTDLALSGFRSDNTEVRFSYPNSFETGAYRLRLHNVRGSTISNLGGVLDVYEYPVISGFSPTTGVVDETTITISGAFEAITGLKIGDTLITGSDVTPFANSDYITGIQFTPNENVASARIEVLTSGGNETTPDLLNIVPGSPSISGFWIGTKDNKPSYVSATGDINYDQVFSKNDLINISGKRLNLVTGIELSGRVNKIVEDNFLNREYENVTIRVPQTINSGSGLFNTVDFLGRTGEFPSGLNILNASGFSNYVEPGGEILISGFHLNGMSVGLPSSSGGYVHKDSTLVTTVGDSETIRSYVPTGVLEGSIQMTGRENSGILIESSGFKPLAGVEGVTGLGAGGAINIGDNFLVTGSNFFVNDKSAGFGTENLSGSGQYGIMTGTGWSLAHFPDEKTGIMAVAVSATGFESGVYSPYSTSPLSKTHFVVGDNFIGTGHFILASPCLGGEDYARQVEEFSIIDYQSYRDPYPIQSQTIPNLINYFPTLFKVDGTYVDVTGFGPSGGITGTQITLTGQGFDKVSDVFFTIENPRKYNDRSNIESTGLYFSGDYSDKFPAKSVTFTSDTVMSVTVPPISVSQRSAISILLQGGTSALVRGFELFVDNQAFVEKVIANDEASPEISAGQVGEYTVEETIQGAVWYITYKKYPDGTKSIINSFPKAGA